MMEEKAEGRRGRERGPHPTAHDATFWRPDPHPDGVFLRLHSISKTAPGKPLALRQACQNWEVMMAEEDLSQSQAATEMSGNESANPGSPGATSPTDWVDTVRSLVRPFLAVSFATATIALTFKGLLAASVVGTATTAIAAFYFGERSALKGAGPPAAGAAGAGGEAAGAAGAGSQA